MIYQIRMRKGWGWMSIVDSAALVWSPPVDSEKQKKLKYQMDVSKRLSHLRKISQKRTRLYVVRILCLPSLSQKDSCELDRFQLSGVWSIESGCKYSERPWTCRRRVNLWIQPFLRILSSRMIQGYVWTNTLQRRAHPAMLRPRARYMSQHSTTHSVVPATRRPTKTTREQTFVRHSFLWNDHPYGFTHQSRLHLFYY